jgi:hypothetical protein
MVAGYGVNDKSLIWPQLVADDLDLELINHGIPGGSNKAIWRSVMETEFNSDDLVIIQWTYSTRFCFFTNPNVTVDLRGGMLEQKTVAVDRNFLEVFYGDMFTFYDAATDLLGRANHIHHHLNAHGVSYMMNQVWPTTEFHQVSKAAWNQVEICYLFDIPELKKKYSLAEDNEHPGYQANKIMSECYLTEIKQKLF